MSTPVSSSTSYASVTDLVNAHDVHKICDYATDTGVSLAPGALATDAKVAAALLRASGEVEMACFKGGRYTPTDLSSLTGASAAALKGIVVDLAFYHLCKRRIPNPKEASPGYIEAMEMLSALSKGELIFGIQEAADAGVMGTVDTSTDENSIYNRPTEQASRFFGRRGDNFGSNPLTGYS